MKHLLTILLLATTLTAAAQCTYKNNAFKKSEYITYNLYFNWKFVWVKAGTASMTTVPTVYRGQKAWRTSLVTKSSDKVDKLFMMRDTILTYFTQELTPLYYRKGAREGDRYYVDEMWYSYSGQGNVQTTLRHLHADRTRTAEKHLYQQCVTDMLNAFQQFRNVNPAGWKPGHTENIDIAGGAKVEHAKIKYIGKEKVKADNNKTYNTLVLAYIEKEDGRDKEIVRFFVTADNRHIPVRLDLNLRFGTAKAFLAAVR